MKKKKKKGEKKLTRRSLSRPTPSGRSSRSKQRDKATTPRSRAKRDFNRAAMRERSKWERETVSNTPDQGFRSSTVPGWGRGSNGAADDGTYAVATLLVAWSGLRNAPPQSDRRKKKPWFWQEGGGNRDEDRDSGFSVFSRWVGGVEKMVPSFQVYMKGEG